MTILQPSLLSYSRSIQPGKGLFYSISYNENGKEIKKPIIVEQIGVRGTQSTHSAGKGFYDEDGDWHGLSAIAFLDSHKNLEPAAGYAFLKILPLNENNTPFKDTSKKYSVFYFFVKSFLVKFFVFL